MALRLNGAIFHIVVLFKKKYCLIILENRIMDNLQFII